MVPSSIWAASGLVAQSWWPWLGICVWMSSVLLVTWHLGHLSDHLIDYCIVQSQRNLLQATRNHLLLLGRVRTYACRRSLYIGLALFRVRGPNFLETWATSAVFEWGVLENHCWWVRFSLLVDCSAFATWPGLYNSIWWNGVTLVHWRMLWSMYSRRDL